jgi:lipopolysaccharide export system permease protein
MVSTGRLARYVGGRVAVSIAGVAGVLTALYLGIDLVREAADMTGGYGLVDVAWFLLRTAPARVYDLFPFAALIGAMLALGGLSARGELVAMRACGFARPRISTSAIGVAAVFGIAVMLVGELVAPRLELAARIDRERAMDRQLGAGAGPSLWIRDGDLVVHAGLIAWRDDDRVVFGDLRIYSLAGPSRFERIRHAETARHVDGRWLLTDSVVLDPADGSVTRHAGERALRSGLDPDVFRALATRPRLLPIADIVRIRRHLEDNEQGAVDYRQAFWRRLLYPVNLLAMLFAGVALLLRAGRGVPPAVGVFAGVSLGIGFIVVHRLVLGLAPVLPLPFGITHLLPAAVFAYGGALLLRR